MKTFRKTISIFLVLNLWQFFVPVLNVAMELPCCEEQATLSVTMPCCSAEYPSRMVCCSGKPAHGVTDSAPTQATLEKSLHAYLAFVPLDQFVATDLDVAPTISVSQDVDACNFYLSSNHRYVLLATFLI